MKTFVEFELKEAEMRAGSALLRASSKNGTVPTQPSNGSCLGEIPTTTAGELWGAYLMTASHSYNKLVS